MKKKGVSLPFNTIIVAAIALVVLVVILVIYTNFIRKSADDIGKPAEAAGLKANDAAWCISAFMTGGDCVVEGAANCGAAGTCNEAQRKWENNKCSLICPSDKPDHKVADANEDRSFSCKEDPNFKGTNNPANRYCCCS